jgi:hypothetical protein
MNHDPQIPRRGSSKPRGRQAKTTTGWFVFAADGSVALQTRRGHQYALKWVSICQGFWGDVANGEGVSKLPRVREFDADGNVTVAGDRVVIDFLEGDSSMPIVRGGVRGISQDDFLPYNHERDGANTNRLGGRLVPLDSDGEATGSVEWEACYDDGPSLRVSAGSGSVRNFFAIGADGSIQIGNENGATVLLTADQVAMMSSQGNTVSMDDDGIIIASSDGADPPASNSYVQLKADGTIVIGGTGSVQVIGSSIELGGGGAPPLDRYLLASTLLADLALIAADLVTVAAATIPPTVLVNTPATIPKFAASLAAGPPYSSLTIKGT